MPRLELTAELVSEQAIHRSCNQNQTTIIKSIISLHNEGRPFALDPCFNRGVMYGSGVGSAPLPDKRMDIDWSICMEDSRIEVGDFLDMPFSDSSFHSIIADPPFIVGKDNAVMSQRYGHYESIDDLQLNLDGLVKECRRVIERGGLLVLKCQDIILNRRKYFVSQFLINTANKYGFNLIDEYIKTNKSRPTQMAGKAHACRSYHSKFLVFRFRRGRRAYVI